MKNFERQVCREMFTYARSEILALVKRPPQRWAHSHPKKLADRIKLWKEELLEKTSRTPAANDVVYLLEEMNYSEFRLKASVDRMVRLNKQPKRRGNELLYVANVMAHAIPRGKIRFDNLKRTLRRKGYYNSERTAQEHVNSFRRLHSVADLRSVTQKYFEEFKLARSRQNTHSPCLRLEKWTGTWLTDDEINRIREMVDVDLESAARHQPHLRAIRLRIERSARKAQDRLAKQSARTYATWADAWDARTNGASLKT